MKKILCFFMCLIMVIGCVPLSLAAASDTVSNVLQDTAQYVYNTVKNPTVGSVGGEWAVLGLARSGAEIPDEYYEKYYENVRQYAEKCGGVLHEKKYTEYSRVVLALTAIGKNPSDVSGYNLLIPLGDYKKTVWQGINGAVWALISLDSGNYKIPENPDAEIQATREMYIKHILECQLPGGGWALSGSIPDPDITAMALQALAKYQNNTEVKQATEKALLCLSELQEETGGFSSRGNENSESCAQIIVALCELGIAYNDSRFVKNGNTLLDNLLTYYSKGKGFRHTADGGDTNLMATEQALYCLSALKRAQNGENSLYSMDDVTFSKSANSTWGLVGKHADISKPQIVSPGKTFMDISGHENRTAIEKLSERGIINGKAENSFEPDSTMTRAEFAAIIVRGLGLPEKGGARFTDVTGGDWFYGYVNTACAYGIVKGVSETEFNPHGTISREEAAVMVARAADLCGMDTEITTFDARNILAGFTDYIKSSEWAVESLAFCCGNGILPDDAMELKPMEAVKRAEIAQMLYNMLVLSRLILE